MKKMTPAIARWFAWQVVVTSKRTQETDALTIKDEQSFEDELDFRGAWVQGEIPAAPLTVHAEHLPFPRATAAAVQLLRCILDGTVDTLRLVACSEDCERSTGSGCVFGGL